MVLTPDFFYIPKALGLSKFAQSKHTGIAGSRFGKVAVGAGSFVLRWMKGGIFSNFIYFFKNIFFYIF